MRRPKKNPVDKKRIKRTIPEQKAAFLAWLSRCGNITRACQLSKVPRPTVYNWRNTSEKFKLAWDEAANLGTDALEDEANRRAFQGVEKPVFQGKELVGHIREYSDTLLIFLLKGRRPNKYRDRVSAEFTGANGGPIEHDHKHRINIDEFRRLPLAERIAELRREIAACPPN